MMAEILPKELVVHGGNLVTMDPSRGPDPYGGVRDGAIAIEGGRIRWVGPVSELPSEWASAPRKHVGGALISPALVDCHTHLVYGGTRAREFELRLQGATYEAIARAGGGILSTVRETRARSVDELVESAEPRLRHLMNEGVTTIEIKSGYGLTVESEITMLRAARRLGELHGIRVRTTYLAAHAVPPEYHERPEDYIDRVVLPGLEAAHGEGLVDAVDGFCEGIAFSVPQMRRVFEHARTLGLPVKLHAEQLSNLGGAALVASFNGLSADHVEYVDQAGVDAMAASGTVAVLLPGAFYTLRETQLPPVELFKAAGVPIALATDCNPGSSPLTSILLTLNLGCTLFRLTPAEALAGVTRVAAQALGLGEEVGVLAPGYRAELAVWSVSEPAELAYNIGFNPLKDVLVYGS